MTLDPPGDGPENMGRDVEMLRLAEQGQGSARVYSWDGLWVTLGRSQHPDQALVDSSRTRWLFRPTGGSAVLHGHDLTVALAAPIGRPIRNLYRLATRPLIDAIHSSGISAALAEEIMGLGGSSHGPRSHDCFAEAARTDIIDRSTGRKICGCALRRTRAAILLQASIPVSSPLCRPAEILVGGVDVIPTSVDPPRFVEALRAALSDETIFASEAR